MIGGDTSSRPSLLSLETRRTLYEFQQEGLLTDVTITVKDGDRFHAHKILLATASGYFRALFTTQLSKESDALANLPQISAEMMGHMLDYMYLKRLDINKDNVIDLFIIADYLVIDGAVDLCCKFLVSLLQPHNCILLWKFGRTYSSVFLSNKTWDYIMENFLIIREQGPFFMDLEIEDLLAILSSDTLNVKTEDKVWETAVAWMEHAPGRGAYVLELMRSVRLGLLAAEYFLERVRDHPLVAQNENCRPLVIDTLRLLFELDVVVEDFSDVLPLELARPRLPHQVIFAVGGWSGGSPTNCMEAYDTRADCWSLVTQTDPMGPRAYHGTAVIGHEIYVIGGYNGFDYYNNCRCYNVVDRKWREISSMNKSRCYVSVAVMGDSIYAMGGYNGQRRQNTAERYDVKSNQWTMIADMNNARSDASATALNGKIYIVGGFNGQECMNSAEVYDPEANEWVLIKPMNERRSGVSCIAYNEAVYVLGGFNGLSRMASGEIYYPRTGVWRNIPDMIHARSNFGISTSEDLLYVVGGFNGVTTTSDVECYSISANEWYIVHSLNIGRSALSACTVTNIACVKEYAFRGKENYLLDRRLPVLADGVSWSSRTGSSNNGTGTSRQSRRTTALSRTGRG